MFTSSRSSVYKQSIFLKEWKSQGRLLFTQNTEQSSKIVIITSILHQTNELIALLSQIAEQLPNLPFHQLCAFFAHSFFFFLILRQHSDSDSHCREARETSKQESLSGSFPMAVLQLDLDHTVFSASDPEPLKRITSRHTFLSSTVDRLEKQSFKCSDS